MGAVTPTLEDCNGIDDNCDGIIDNLPSRACYDGPAGTRGVGACRDGTQSCASGAWGACVGAFKPNPEACNGMDDDCNGIPDDNVAPIACYFGPPGTEGVGTCRPGTQTCSNGVFGPCVGATVPVAETCNGNDDDCNHITDDGLPPATCGVGACARTGSSCNPASCTPGTPTQEICNGIDDDCDGIVDNHLAPLGTCDSCEHGTFVCENGALVCRGASCCDGHNGSQTCRNGVLGACTVCNIFGCAADTGECINNRAF
jgi:hypothetical protein